MAEGKEQKYEVVDILVGWDTDDELRAVEEADEYGEISWAADPRLVRLHIPLAAKPTENKRPVINVFVDNFEA